MLPLNKILFFNDFLPARTGELNMALDEILLRECSLPWLRCYGWSRQTLSIGYFTPVNSVEFGNVPWIRRWTGGGAVHHGGTRDATYAFGIPRGDPASSVRSSSAYKYIHQSVQRALLGIGIACRLADGYKYTVAGTACFENPVISDVITCHGGLKIAGGAQRRSRYGLLHQGSIQDVLIPADFGFMLANSLSRNIKQEQVDDDILGRASMLAISKYSTPEWKFRK
ncbi:MAG: hypothetical protein VCA55_12925 [Verrucomicrobiales bacterium]